MRKYIREPFCGLSHFGGAAISVVGLVLLLIAAHGRPWHTVSYAVYGVTLIALYTSSGLYHSLKLSERGEYNMMRMDHMNIFLLIAGSWTPICLIALRGAWGWSMFGVQWGLAIFGIITTYVWHSRPHWVRVALYIIMGWLALAAIGQLKAALPSAGFNWLVAGGVVYTLGAVVYATDKPHLWPGFSAHDLWHIFVLGGSICHFILVFVFLSRMP